MKYEKIVDKNTGYGLNIAGGQVDSLRVKNDLKTVIRVYDGGNIGIAGAIGECDERALAEQAKANLALNIPYPCNLAKGCKRSENAAKTVIPAGDFVKTVKKLMARLNAAYPDFIFGNKINMDDSEKHYTNGEGTAYDYASNMLTVALTIKSKASANIMDLFYAAYADYYDENGIVEDIGKLLNAFSKKLPMPDEDLPVIIEAGVIAYVLGEMGAEKYASGSSLYSGKFGAKIFNEKVNVYTDRSPLARDRLPFFDAEGTVNEDDKFYFVKGGVFCGVSTYKRSAEKFGLPLSGGAALSEYDSVPIGYHLGATAGVTADKLKDIVKGKAIYVSYASGGDMTPDGTLGLPVQLAYLYEDGKLLGALPEFSLTANVNDVFGKDFLGFAKNDVFTYADELALVSKFKINRA